MNKTMVMKKDRRKRDIKSKLLAAIAMLMVSCIMVVSSTYAWFTLSTAPEVTGISTAIGANGNLEMALLPGLDNTDTAYATVADALAAIGDATGNQTVVERNTTWGNLVDLSDDVYGLDQISLFPAKLGLSEDNLADYYLGTPKYGADGRFVELATNASAAIYNNGTFGTNSFGVRAVGTSSGMSAHELAFRDVLSDANDAFNKAVTQTKTATSQGGSALASLAVTKATNSAATYGQADISKLNVAYTALDTALGYVETALKQYITAYALANGGYNDTNYLAALQVMENATLDQMASYANGSTLGSYITTLTSLRGEVTTALTKLEGMTAETYQWTDISGMVTALADIETMKLNGQPIKYYLEKGAVGTENEGQFIHINELVSNMSNLVLEVNTTGTPDTGIYARMADFVDTYSTPVTISGVSYGGITVDSLNATMKINATAKPAYLPTAKTAANAYPDNAFGNGGGSSLSDFYGYIIDMAFRTNAAGSSLQLQTDAVDRVYADNDSNPNTMGGGSSMTYSIAGVEGFGADRLENLMGYIRVVFFDPATHTIFGEARLDPDTAVTEGDETTGFSVTMKLKMWDPNANGEGQGAWASTSIITALEQNTAKVVSTLVYLDGEDLTNADVANANLTGTMNIQFSSTAELKPMEYGDLRNDNTTEKEEYSVTVNGISLQDATVVEGATYTLTRDQYATLIPQGQTVASVTVTMGGTEVVRAYDPSTGNITVSNVSGDIVVNVTLSGT